MLTAIQISAFLLFLSAFGVGQDTIKSVEAILQPKQATSTSITVPTTLQATPDGGASVTITPLPQPQFSGTIVPMDKSGINVTHTKETYVQDGQTVVSYHLFAEVLNNEGVAQYQQMMHIDAPDAASQGFAWSGGNRTTVVKDGAHWYADWVYKPTTKGTQAITFSSNGFTKTVEIVVE